MSEGVGCLVMLLFLGVILVFGGILVTSKAVLINEKQSIQAGYGFDCTYFTGTRTIVNWTPNTTGCKRFIDVGG